jgi:hypothetical protein
MRKTIAALGALYLAFAFGAVAQAQTANLNPIGVDPEHYQCYPITKPSAFEPRTVTLKDQFGLKTVQVIGPRLLCAPVSKNGGLLADSRSHLVCYAIQGQIVGKRVEVTNQFGKLQFDVGTANMLCVPSLKRVLPATG